MGGGTTRGRRNGRAGSSRCAVVVYLLAGVQGPQSNTCTAGSQAESMGGQVRKSHSPPTSSEGPDRKKPLYFEFAKKKWEEEEDFR